MKQRILGLDPGLATIGYAILEVDGRQKKLLQIGVIKTPSSAPLDQRLMEIDQDLDAICKQWKPNIAGVEQLFYTKNITNGIQVAHARGVMLLQLHKHGIPFLEWTPSQMKLALTGNGKADKQAIQKMVMLELGLKSPPKPDDAADALSLALSLAAQQRFQ